MKRKIITVVSFVLALTLTLGIGYNVLSFKYLDSTTKLKSFYELPENSVDVLVLGSSHAYQGINTAVMWQEYGYTVFNLCGPAQPIWNTYYYFEEALKTQSPKVVILDVYTVHFAFDYDETSNAIKNTYGLKWSDTKKEAIKASFDSEKYGEQYLYEFLQTHSRYSDLSKTDFYPYMANEEMYESYKGFYCYYKSKEVADKDYTDVDYLNYMTEKNYEYYTKILELAKERNISIFVTAIPFAANNYYVGHFNEAQLIAEQYGVPFYNLLKEYKDDLGLDYKTDFADNQHLNHLGNTKLTKFFGDIIKKDYKLQDKRGDEKYASWQTDANNFYHQVKNSEVAKTKNLPSYLEIIDNEQYTVICSVSCADVNELKLMSRAALYRLKEATGIDAKGTGGFWVIENGQISYSNTQTKDGFSKAYNLGISDGALMTAYDITNEDGSVRTVNHIYFNKEKKTNVNNGLTFVVYDNLTQTLVDVAFFNFNTNEFDR